MNKTDAQKELDALKLRESELLNIINKPEVTAEQRFLELMNGLTIRIDKDKYPDSVFYFRGDAFMVEITNSKVWFNYYKFWIIFETEFDMYYNQIQDFTQSMLEKHFKMKAVSTKNQFALILNKLEKHFKMKAVSTGAEQSGAQYSLEKHFKMKAYGTI